MTRQRQPVATRRRWNQISFVFISHLILTYLSTQLHAATTTSSIAATLFSSLALEDSSTSHLGPPPSSSSLGELIHVQLLHRHGDRSPVHINPHDTTMWQERFGLHGGQLSTIGQAQLHSLGRFLRKEYVHSLTGHSFLPPVPGPSLHVRSTDVDRCLQSVHALLDELYPRSLIPVHTIPEDVEKLLQSTDKCPSYLLTYRGILAEMDELLEKKLSNLPHPPTDGDEIEGTSDHDQQMSSKSFNLLEYLAKESGWADELQPANLLSIVTDNIVCLTSHHLPIPPLLQHAFPLLKNYTKAILFHKYSTTHVRRHWSQAHGFPFTMPDDKEAGEGKGMDPRGSVGGVLIKHLVKHFEEILNARVVAAEDAANSAALAQASAHATKPARRLLELATESDIVEDQDHVDQNEVSDRLTLSSHRRSLLQTSHRYHSNALPSRTVSSDKPGSTVPTHAAHTSSSSMSEKVTSSSFLAVSSQISSAASAAAATKAEKFSRKQRYLHQHQLNLADEKLMIYSAHDTTLLALFVSMGLVLSPESDYLFPPYAASLTLELRYKPEYSSSGSSNSDEPFDGYFVNAFYGFPLPAQGDATQTEWEYHRHPLALRCLTKEQEEAGANDPEALKHDPDQKAKWLVAKQWQCSLGDFKRYIRFLSRSSTAQIAKTHSSLPQHHGSGAYSPTDGCCEKTESFYVMDCASKTRNVTDLARECLAFRQRCPSNACEVGEQLNTLTLICEPTCHGAVASIGGGSTQPSGSIWSKNPKNRPNPKLNKKKDKNYLDLSIPESSEVNLPETDGVSPYTLSGGIGVDPTRFDAISVTPPIPTPQLHRDWIFFIFCVSCLIIGLYACYRSERMRKDLLLYSNSSLYRDGVLGIGDESGPSSNEDSESLLANGGGRGKRKSQSSAFHL